tara:strand:+ start:7440 stop:8291 length:852 start_codon:yes stop_codon:yes gene_type:complete
MRTLAICIRYKDDLDCLKENIEYHTLIGVEHFFIYDNNSAVPLKESLKEYENVTVELWQTGGKLPHLAADVVWPHNKCLRDHGSKFQWIAFIDTDEFITIKDGNTDLKDFLKPYSDYGGLGINWLTFGSSGHENIQPSVVESYTRCLCTTAAARHPTLRPYGLSTIDLHIKTIVNTRFATRAVGNPHAFYYIAGANCVDEDFKSIPRTHHEGALTTEIKRKKIQLNHYRHRSRKDFELKIKRSRWSALKIREKWEMFNNLADLKDQDTSILNLIEKCLSTKEK